MPYKVNPTTGQLDYYEVSEGGGGGVATNLAFIPSPTSGTVTSDSGTDADITLATTTNSGLFSPVEKAKLDIALVNDTIFRGAYSPTAVYGLYHVVDHVDILYQRINSANAPGIMPPSPEWVIFDPLIGSPVFDFWIRTQLDNRLISEGINYQGDYNNGSSYPIDAVVSTPEGSPYGLPGQLFIRTTNPGNPGYPPGTPSWAVYNINIGSPAFDAWIRSVLQTKVTVEIGKGLSTEDYTTAEQTKLSGIAAGATANDTDANLKDRANHTGTQSASTISDIQSTITNNTQVLANTDKISFDSTSSTRLANTSGTNTGDNAVNSLYSGLAASKQNALGFTPAPIASPTFTGIPTVPSPSLSDSSSQIVSTAWINAKGYNRWFGIYNASTNTLTSPQGSIIPTIFKFGDTFTVSVAGVGHIDYGGSYYNVGDVWTYGKLGEEDSFLLATSIQTGTLSDYSSTTGTIATTDSVVNAISKLNGNIASKQNAITLTTTGTSGAATLSGNTLNIPQYSGGATTNVFELKANYVYRGITINNNSTVVGTEGGVVMSSSASNTAQSVASTNFATKQIRLRYYATSVTGGRYSGTRGSALLWYIQGGFHYVCDFNISDTAFAAGCQQFYGMAGQTTDLSYGTSTPILVSTSINIVGIGNEVGDTNLQVFHNDATGTASKIDLGIDFPANRTSGAISTTFYSVQLYNAPSSTDVHYKVTNNETGAVATGVVSTNLPLSSQGLNFFASRSMAATSVTSTGQFDLSNLGVYSIL